MGFIAQNEGPIYECLGGRGFQHFTPSELLQRSSYNVTFVALKPYPMRSITLQKITLLNVAVKTGIENNSKSRDYVYGIWQYKKLSNYIYIYIKYCKPSKMIWEENWPATRVMYKGVNKGKNNSKVPTTIMLPHLIIRPNKYSMVSCNITIW